MELTAGTMSFGEELKRERELRDISLREVSESTKISLRYLEALERNDFKSLPGGVFNRGFVRAYSQFIGVDPDTMVDAYIQQATAFPVATPSPPRRGGERRGAGGKHLWVWAVVGALALAAATYFGWTYVEGSRNSPVPTSQPAAADESGGKP